MPTTRRTFVQMASLAGATAALSGCDSAVESFAALFEDDSGPFQPPASDEIDLETHVLNRLTWGPRPGDYDHVHTIGVDAFIDRQIDYAQIPDRAVNWKTASIESVHEPAGELYEYDSGQLLSDLTRYKILRATYSRRQLYEVMVDLWTDHFNIVSEKDQCRWLKTADDRDVIRAHALGSFRAMVRASALSPAMLIYLDGHANKVERPGDRPNENYARELLELHTLGVHGGYTQKDVMEVARCLSGWTYQNKPFSFKAVHVEFAPPRHDDGEKVVLGHVIPAGGGASDLERVLDIVCAHPSTAKHIATKLCRRFIADPAPESAVRTVGDAFTRSGGDIRETLRALFATDEFRQSRGSIFKRPLNYVVSALRATDASTSCGPVIIESLLRMGHAPFQYPTPDGYPIEAQPWLGTLLWRWNFAIALERGGIGGTSIDLDGLVARAGGAEQAAAHVLGRALTPLEIELLNESANPLALMLSSPAFQMH